MGDPLVDVSSYSASVIGPNAGDPVTAASVRVMGTALANRTKYLNDRATALTAADVAISAASSVVVTGQTTLTAVGTGGGSLETFSVFDGAFHSSSVVILDFAFCDVGDKVQAHLVFDVSGTAAPGADWQLRLTSIQDYGGTAVTAALPGSLWYTQESDRMQVTLQGSLTIATAGTLRIVLQVRTAASGAILSNLGTGCLMGTRYTLGI